MSTLLNLSPREKLKIEKLYAKGLKPTEICVELPALKLKPRQVTQFLYKRGWTKRRGEIESTKQQTALEILQRVRQEGVEDFEATIAAISAGIRIDAERLCEGWELVGTAADASALMRAKSLLLDRTLRFHGLETPAQDRSSGNALFFVGDVVRVESVSKPEPEPKQVCEIAEN